MKPPELAPLPKNRTPSEARVIFWAYVTWWAGIMSLQFFDISDQVAGLMAVVLTLVTLAAAVFDYWRGRRLRASFMAIITFSTLANMVAMWLAFRSSTQQ